MCFGRRKITHAVVEAAVATIVPRTQAILRALLRRCFRGSRAAIISYAARVIAALRRLRSAAALRGVAEQRRRSGVCCCSAQVMREQRAYIDQCGYGDAYDAASSSICARCSTAVANFEAKLAPGKTLASKQAKLAERARIPYT